MLYWYMGQRMYALVRCLPACYSTALQVAASRCKRTWPIPSVIRLLYGGSKLNNHKGPPASAAPAQAKFFISSLPQVALPHYREHWFLARAAQRYRRFLHLHRLHGSTTLIPPPDIDLCWRAHQVRSHACAL